VRAKLNFNFEGNGLYSGRVGERAELTILTSGTTLLSLPSLTSSADSDGGVDEKGKVQDIDVGGLDVRVRGPANTNVKAQVHREKEGKFLARYEVNVPGDFTLTVAYDDNKVLEQPLHFSDGASHSSCLCG